MNPRKAKVTHIEKWGSYLSRRDGGMRCHYCSIPLIRGFKNNLEAIESLKKNGFGLATVDHIVPLSKGGSNEPWNMVLACLDCNEAKGDSSYRQFLKTIRLKKTIGAYPCHKETSSRFTKPDKLPPTSWNTFTESATSPKSLAAFAASNPA
jgi:5-methylcytosine-specific restriction endonuclease McrA